MRRIKDGVKAIIESAPIWSIYVRQDRRLPCVCHSSTYNAPNYFCPLCLGTGHKVKLEKIPVRYAAGTRELKGEDTITLLGRIDQLSLRGFTTADTHPKDDDLIMLVMWNKSGREQTALPTAVLRVYSIQIAYPLIQEEISFYEMGLNPYHLTTEFINGLNQHTLHIGKY